MNESPKLVLQARGLGKRYGELPVFSGISLELRAGELVALLGESGCGKSTLLNCLAGLDSVETGEVRLLDQPLSALPEPAQAALRRRALGFVFQAFHVLPQLSVADNVALPLLLLGRPDAARVEQLLEAVGLAGLGERAPRQLSGGQLQRVAIARALVHRPALVLADEPTGNLDPRHAAQVLELLRAQCRQEGAACLLVTHSERAAASADRCLRMDDEGLQPWSPSPH